MKKVQEMQTSKTSQDRMSRGIGLGAIGGCAGMLVMDFVIVIEFLFAEMPLDTYLKLIGSVIGGGVLMGVILHLLVGTLAGLILGIAVIKFNALNVTSFKKGVGLGFLMGVLTIPFGCVPFALLVGSPILTLVSFSTLPHLVWGTILGVFLGFGLPR